jgi:hypothetical protein
MGQNDVVEHQALVGVDFTVASTGNTISVTSLGGSRLITATSTGTALHVIDMLFIRGPVNLNVSNITFEYDGGPAAKQHKAIHYGMDSGYTLTVRDSTFIDFFQAICGNGPLPVSSLAHSAVIVNNHFKLRAGLSGIYSLYATNFQPKQAIFFHTGSHILVEGNDYDGDISGIAARSGDGLLLSYATGNGIYNNEIVHYSNEGIYILRMSNDTISYPSVISGNRISKGSTTTYAIRSDEKSVIISNNVILDAQCGIYINVADAGPETGRVSTATIVTDNNIEMRADYVTGWSVGIYSRAPYARISGNIIRWPLTASGYGAVDSSGILTGSGAYNLDISDNMIYSERYDLSFNTPTGLFVPGELITGGTSGAISYVYSVGAGVMSYGSMVAHPNNNSYKKFIVGETITGYPSTATGVITSLDTPITNLSGIEIDPTGPVRLSGNRTTNLDKSVNLIWNAATKNGPLTIDSHLSDSDNSKFAYAANYTVGPLPGQSVVYRNQEIQFYNSAANWHRIQEAVNTLGGTYTITQDNELVCKFIVHYIAQEVDPGKIEILAYSDRAVPYINGIRVGVFSGLTDIALDISFTAAASGLSFKVNLDTTLSSQLLLLSLANFKTLAIPTTGAAAPATALVSVVLDPTVSWAGSYNDGRLQFKNISWYGSLNAVGLGATPQLGKFELWGPKTNSGTYNDGIFVINDTTPMAANVGGSIAFTGFVNATPVQVRGGSISLYKVNATSGNEAFGLKFNTKANSAVPTAKFILDDLGAAIVTTGNLVTRGVGNGFNMKSPDGNCWSVTVSNAGALVVAGAACE